MKRFLQINTFSPRPDFNFDFGIFSQGATNANLTNYQSYPGLLSKFRFYGTWHRVIGQKYLLMPGPNCGKISYKYPVMKQKRTPFLASEKLSSFS